MESMGHAKQVKAWVKLVQKYYPALVENVENDVRQVIEMSFLESEKSGEPVDRAIRRNIRQLAADLGLVPRTGKAREVSAGGTDDLASIIDMQYGAESAEDTAARLEFGQRLNEFASTLTETQRTILFERLLGDEPIKQRVLAARFRIGRPAICKREQRLKKKIKTLLVEAGVAGSFVSAGVSKKI